MRYSSRAVFFCMLFTANHALLSWGDESGYPVMSDREFFAALDCDRRGLEAVKTAVSAGRFAAARQHLATYYRQRQGSFWWFDPSEDRTGQWEQGPSFRAIRNLRDREGSFAAERFLENGEFNWYHPDLPSRWVRMYFWEGLGRGYWESGRQEWAAREWVRLMRSFIRQCSHRQGDRYWATMTVGIQLRTGWPNAFCYFLHSQEFTPDDMVLFLKATLERARYLRANHSETSNWLTFEMAGLYCTGVLYPEFREAHDWRRHAAEVAVEDMARGYLPDGASIELSPGYHQFFSNYLTMVRLAKTTGRLRTDGLHDLVTACEKPFEFYVRLMGPDRYLPAFNDNGPVNAARKLQPAIELFPERADFEWVVSDGERGRPPAFESCFLPYAGLGTMRSGWERSANVLAFKMGPVGYRHAHQDKLSLVVWAQGRQILFDPGCADYRDSPETRYCRDTFSHNTVLVDQRPQRRRWYQHPHPRNMPYKPLEDLQWESGKTLDWVSARYDEAYGKPGPSDSYPYKEGSDFLEGWGKPATHCRQVLFLKPDVFVVWDRLESRDGAEHTYDARWHLDTIVTKRQAAAVYSADPEQPNLAVVPLLTDGLEVRATSAQRQPELLGWHVLREARPATTIQHLKRGVDADLVTILLPLAPGAESAMSALQVGDAADGRVTVVLPDGRRLTVRVPERAGLRLEGSLDID